MFDASDIAEFDDLVEESSPDSIAIRRDTAPADDGHGGQTENYQTASTVAGAVGSLGNTPMEQEIAGAYQGSTLVRITVPRGTDVTRNDLIQVNGAQQYEIVGVTTVRSYESRRIIAGRAIS